MYRVHWAGLRMRARTRSCARSGRLFGQLCYFSLLLIASAKATWAQPTPPIPAQAETSEDAAAAAPAVPSKGLELEPSGAALLDQELGKGRGEVIEIQARPPAESASSVHFSAKELARRPHATPSDLLRQAPGLMVSQHAGGGKADQLFLRGFDADHGTDVALFVDGVPVNLTSHGHGQGYADTHWIIPETIAGLDVTKGPYSARLGDFNTGGAIAFKTIDEVPGMRVSLSGGMELSGSTGFESPDSRIVALASPQLPSGKSLLATEMSYSDGPFENPQGFRRGLVLGKWRGPAAGGDLNVTATGYAAIWNQSGQIPQRAVDDGRLDRFGAVDPGEGGTTSRNSLAVSWTAPDQGDDQFEIRAYVVDYRFRLYSNFTLFARDPDNGDQIEQTDARTLAGLTAFYSRKNPWSDITGYLNAGVQLRADNIEADLWHTSGRQRLANCFATANPCNRVTSRVRNLAAFIEEDLYLAEWIHVIAGLRFDTFIWDVDDRDPETSLSPQSQGGTASRAMVNPKLSIMLKPQDTVEVFLNSGTGFHSNDARAAVSSGGRGALARAVGAEVGVRFRPMPALRTALAAWFLHLTSEQVWSGDNGGTEPGDPSNRRGIDFDISWDAAPWLALDANLALARATRIAMEGKSGDLALAPKIMGGGGVTLHRPLSSVSLRARGVGDRPANDDNSLVAEGFLVFDLVASHRIGPWQLGLTMQNMLDAEWREAQFAEESQLPGEIEPIEDIHFTPGSPRMAIATIGYTY